MFLSEDIDNFWAFRAKKTKIDDKSFGDMSIYRRNSSLLANPDEDLTFSEDETSDSEDFRNNTIEMVRSGMKSASTMNPSYDLYLLVDFALKIKDKQFKIYNTTNEDYLRRQAEKQAHLKKAKITKDNVSFKLEFKKFSNSPKIGKNNLTTKK